MKRIFAGLVCIAILAAGAAEANESGPYVSGALGLIDTSNNSVLGTPLTPELTGKTDDDEISWSGALGYRFKGNVALELGYVDLGEITSNVTDATALTDAHANVGFSSEGATLALIGAFPIGKWEPYLKAGVLFSRTALTYSGSISGVSFNARITARNEDPFYGIGLRYALFDELQLFLDATFFDEVGEPHTGRSTYFNTSAGVTWRF